MTSAVDKKLLFSVIDALPPEELSLIYRMFSSFIDDYLDARLTKEELEEHLEELEDAKNGNFTTLSDLLDQS